MTQQGRAFLIATRSQALGLLEGLKLFYAISLGLSFCSSTGIDWWHVGVNVVAITATLDFQRRLRRLTAVPGGKL